MALLNFAKTYDEVKSYLSLTESNSGDYVKLIFTKDGHIITHGHDYTRDYDGQRGLVPTYNASDDYAVLTKTGWGSLTTNFLPMGDSAQAAVDKLWSSNKIVSYVETYFADAIKANDAMLFKGVLSTTDTGDGIYANVPVSGYHAGWTYRVKTAGNYAGKDCEVGDIIIAVSDASSSQTAVEASHWQVVQTNIKGKRETLINGSLLLDFYTDRLGDQVKFYAPTDSGNENDILISKGAASAPVWVQQSAINAGQLGGTAKEDLLTNVTAANGSVSVTVGGTTKTATAAGDWNINAASANKVNHLLKVTGNGLTNVEFDGSAEKTISLQPATYTTLGGVIVDEDTVTVNSGKISLTEENIVNALGYRPENILNSVIVSDKHQGLAPQITGSAGKVNESFYFLAYNPSGTANGDKGIEANWYELPSNVLGNSWRPVSINGTELFDSSNTSTNIVNFKNGNLIQITKDATDNSIVVSTTAEINQNAFSKITVGTTEVAATVKTDNVTFKGANVKIEATAADKEILFSVADFTGVGTKGLVEAPAGTSELTFLRADGTWVVPTDTNTWRSIVVKTTTEDKVLSNDITSGPLTIQAGKDIAVDLQNNTLTIASTFNPQVYSAGTGIDSVTNGLSTVFSLKEATVGELGGIKLFTEKGKSAVTPSEDGRIYDVKLDSNGKAFVNVPWTDSKIRDIQINGVSIGDDMTLNIKPSEEIHIIKDDSSTTGVYEIGFGLSWYNITDEKYEMA